MNLEPIEVVNGILSLFILVIFLIAGIFIALKYVEVKNKTYIWWGIGILGMGLPWSCACISFLLIIMGGEPLTLEQYLFASLFPQPITMMFYLWAITELRFKEKQKIILGIYGVIGISFEIYLISNLYLLKTPENIGTFVDYPLDMTYLGLAMLYSIFLLASVAVFLLFVVVSGLKSDNPEVKLKAKFNLIAIISYVIGSVFDGSVGVNVVAVFIIRILLMSCAVEFYIGWIMPESVKKAFLKSV